jgi:hypothetical protein
VPANLDDRAGPRWWRLNGKDGLSLETGCLTAHLLASYGSYGAWVLAVRRRRSSRLTVVGAVLLIGLLVVWVARSVGGGSSEVVGAQRPPTRMPVDIFGGGLPPGWVDADLETTLDAASTTLDAAGAAAVHAVRDYEEGLRCARHAAGVPSSGGGQSATRQDGKAVMEGETVRLLSASAATKQLSSLNDSGVAQCLESEVASDSAFMAGANAGVSNPVPALRSTSFTEARAGDGIFDFEAVIATSDGETFSVEVAAGGVADTLALCAVAEATTAPKTTGLAHQVVSAALARV